MYGLSGASGTLLNIHTHTIRDLHSIGKYNCLWCLITSDQLKIPLETRGKCTKRSLESLRTDHDSFQRAGGQLKNAKFHHNAIEEYLFDIPVENVRPFV